MRDHYEIWERAIGFRPQDKIRITNPFRNDSHAGAYFEWVGSYLRLKDWGNSYYHGINCFDAVAIKVLGHKIGEFGSADADWSAVKEFISGTSYFDKEQIPVNKFHFDLQVESRALTSDEISYYAGFGISDNNLTDDVITGCEFYRYNSSKNPTQYYIRYPNDLAFIQWRGLHKKVYRPHNKEYKFTTDTSGDDYWVFGDSELALVFEGHKDARVAYNLGFTSIGLQSSTILPSEVGLLALRNRFKRIIYIGDWDNAGIQNGERISKIMGVEHRYFDERIRAKLKSKDIADLYKEVGRERACKALNYLQGL